MLSDQTLDHLNPKQIEAVAHKGGPLLVLAGAGTGKTTVITRRIARLISSKLAKPNEILALTFTDKAANEMESRVDLLVPYGCVDVTISTFHSFSDRILRNHAIDLGLRPDYRVISKAEQMVFLREHWHKLPLKHFKSLSDPIRHIEALLAVISRAKDEDISADEYLKWAKRKNETKQIEIARVYRKYQELKASRGFVDFPDQVTFALKLLREHPSILKKYQEKYKFVLVDEFQDTNYAQFQILKLLVKKHKNITIVGDDDQAIYRFRGAAISNILNFKKEYKKCKTVVLTSNYRSTQLILDSAYRLIQHNNPERLEIKSKIDKKLIAERGGGGKKPAHKHFDSFLNEADWVARSIKDKVDKGENKYSDFAILLRANADAKPYMKSLNLLGVPYFFSGGGGLYSVPDVKIAVSFLRVIGNLADNVSLYDLAISNLYYLNPLDMQKINTFVKRRNYTIHYVFSHIEEASNAAREFHVLHDLKDGSFATIKKVMEDVSYYIEYAKTHSTGEVLYHFLKRSGHLMRLTSEDDPQNEDKLKNIAKFFEKVREFHEISEDDRVSEFVKYLDLMKEAGEDPESSQPEKDVDAVNILTVHKAKGLEFPVVYMASLVLEKFPARVRCGSIELPDSLLKEKPPRSDRGDFHLKEERRLFYVGMTRAKNELYLTSSSDYGGKRERKTSQFVLEALDLPRAVISAEKMKPIDQIEMFAPQDLEIIPAKKIKDDEVMPLSYYPIDDYNTCPLKYKYVHVLNIPLLPSHTIMYGSAMHKATQAYYGAALNKHKFSEKELIDIFLNNWSSEGFISREHEEARLKAGKSALKKFYKEQKKTKFKVKYVEEGFKIVKDHIQIKGRFDLVLEERIAYNASRISIVDFKSTEVKSQEEADKRARESMQLAIYAIAWQNMFLALPDSVKLHFLQNGLVGSARKTEKDLEKVWEKIKKISDSIRNLDFHPTPSSIKCGYCPYSDICPAERDPSSAA